MQLHEARRADLSNKKKIRVGRGPGSGLGKTAGRGIKGATSRSGYAMKVTYEGGQMPMFRRLPKRGFTNGPFRETFTVVNVGDLDCFKAGEKVGLEELRARGLLHGPSRNPIKVLGNGELSIALNVSADAFSKSALVKIEKAGGTAEWLGGKPKKEAPNFKKIDAEKKKAADKAKAEKAEKKPEAKAEGEAPVKAKGEKPAKTEGEAQIKAKAEKAAKAAKPEGKGENPGTPPSA